MGPRERALAGPWKRLLFLVLAAGTLVAALPPGAASSGGTRVGSAVPALRPGPGEWNRRARVTVAAAGRRAAVAVHRDALRAGEGSRLRRGGRGEVHVEGLFGDIPVVPGGVSLNGVPGLAFNPVDPLNWPHLSIAPGPDLSVQMVNNTWNIYDRGGRPVLPDGGIPLTTWFGEPFGLTNVLWYGAECLYDPGARRFYQMALGLDFSSFGASYLALAVSETEDPRAAWSIFLGETGHLGTDLRFAVDGRSLIATYTEHIEFVAGFYFPHVRMRAYAKPDLLRLPPPDAVPSYTYAGFANALGEEALTLRPCTHHGANAAFYLINNWNLLDDEDLPLEQGLDIWGLTGPPHALAFTRATVPTDVFVDPPDARQPQRGPQLVPPIHTGTAWLHNAVADTGQIWTCLTTGVVWPGGEDLEAAIKWFQVDARSPATPRLVQEGLFGRRGFDYYHAAIETSAGRRPGMAMVFTRSSPREYPSMRIISRNIRVRPGFLRPSKAVAGARGNGAFGRLSAPDAFFEAALWGPYFGAARDPGRPDRIVLAGAYSNTAAAAAGSGFEWASRIVRIRP